MKRGLQRLALRAGLPLVDAIVALLPARLAYGLADVAGRIWYRTAPARRAMVAANLARVCAATGRPTSGPELGRLVRRAFVEHARYYLELLRVTHYRLERIDERVRVVDWPRHEPLIRSGAVVIATAHLGNFEPFGVFLAAHGLPATAPVEEVEPPELFEFLRRRRGGGRGVQVVPLSRSRHALLGALRRGEIAGLVADRDLEGTGIPVTFFGHDVTMPIGPALLALLTGSRLMSARCLRVGRDRFEGFVEEIAVQPTGNRRADVERLTGELAARFETYVAACPEQWWAASQPFWPDLQP